MNRGRHKHIGIVKRQLNEIKLKYPTIKSVHKIDFVPFKIFEEMAEQQKLQTGKVNLEIFFTRSFNTGACHGGFDWSKTSQGWHYWYKITVKYFYT